MRSITVGEWKCADGRRSHHAVEKMRYVAKSAMGSVKAFLSEGIEKIESKNLIAGIMWENMTEELGEWAKQVETIIKRERWVVLRISLKNDQKEIW